ncbi:hypothetical protein LMK00_05470 [Lactococcus formosensis]|uniref:Uncharacterized protein n=1 Tax=Lactococcus formosensis TaxID=1281486 RepID=A0A9Q8Y4Q2_9LACT|nr:hypothetical protein LMK00_05470 [Lactococcus formosensis]
MGNNYSHKKYYIFGDGNQGYQTASVIAHGQKNSDGAEVISASSDYNDSDASWNEFLFSWDNPIDNGDGTVIGTISYTSINEGSPYTTSASITLQKSMSLGFLSSTGGNYSKMKVSLNDIIARKGTRMLM